MIDINNSKSLPIADIDALATNAGLSAAQFKSSLAGKSWEDYYKSLLVDPVDYYRANFLGQSVFRYIQTHPDLDHMSGLYRFFVEEAIPIQCFWDVSNRKNLETSDFSGRGPYDQLDWLTYRIMSGGKLPHRDEGMSYGDLTVIRNDPRSVGDMWTEDGIEILSPSSDLRTFCDTRQSWNNASYVLKVAYAGRSIVLPGDAEAVAWKSIDEAFSPTELKCNVLKAAHHGRESGLYQPVLDKLNPEFVICSVGKKPSTDASDEYARSGAHVMSTRFHGSIVVTIWFDGEVWIDSGAGKRLATLPPL